MDVHCTTCGEPWDVYHLWHDAIFETGLSVGGSVWRAWGNAAPLIWALAVFFGRVTHPCYT